MSQPTGTYLIKSIIGGVIYTADLILANAPESSVINFGPYHEGYAPEVLTSVSWEASPLRLNFTRELSSQEYHLYFDSSYTTFIGTLSSGDLYGCNGSIVE